MVDLLLDHINISPIRGSALVDVSYSSGSPQISAMIANAWTQQFIQANMDRRMSSTADARTFLEPVSYTHLDVYKRQALLLALALPTFAVIAALAPALFRNPKPVRVLAPVMVALFIPLLLITGSRTGLVLGAVGAVCAILLYRRCLLYTSRCV